jgi:outer membrane protein assembly factor BamB
MKHVITGSLLALVWAGSSASAPAADPVRNDWPRFRGPTGDGLSPAKGIPTTWSKDRNVLWRTDLPKPLKHENVPRKQLEDLPNAYNPWSSPIVSGGKVFLTSAGVKREEHKLLCFDLADGKPLWERQIPPGPIANVQMNNLLENADWVKARDGPPRKATHTATGYGICTPCTDGERIFVTFGSYVLAAADFQGNILWRKPLAKTTDKPPSGGHYANETGVTRGLCMSTSPIIYKDLVIQICESEIMAFDRKTGDLKYRNEQRFGETWATRFWRP